MHQVCEHVRQGRLKLVLWDRFNRFLRLSAQMVGEGGVVVFNGMMHPGRQVCSGIGEVLIEAATCDDR
jgi:hypothetical protein